MSLFIEYSKLHSKFILTSKIKTTLKFQINLTPFKSMCRSLKFLCLMKLTPSCRAMFRHKSLKDNQLTKAKSLIVKQTKKEE